MSNLYPVTPQIKSYFGADGTPLHLGYIYFGNANQDPETNQIPMYWDAAGTKLAAQPFRTKGGYIVRDGIPSNVYAVGDFSCSVKDSKNRLVYTVPNSTDIQLALAVVGQDTASAIAIADAGSYYTSTDVEGALQEVGASLDAIVAGVIPTGFIFDRCSTGTLSGYVRANGRTIGNAASGATERNNADTFALFELLWTEGTDTTIPIQNSSGGASTRGASAAADYAAPNNKRITLPDLRGRTRAGADAMGSGSAQSRLTSTSMTPDGDTLFATGGTQTHALTTAQLASHAHPMASHTHSMSSHTHSMSSHTHSMSSHTHTMAHTHTYTSLPFSNAAQGGGSFDAVSTTTGSATTSGASTPNTGGPSTANTAGPSTANTGAPSTANTGAPSTADTSTAGSGSAHPNVQPSMIVTVYIKL